MTEPGERVALDLIDQDGRRFTHEALTGSPALVYFGFLNCRVVCPRSLAKIAEIRALLADAGRTIRVVYISVDPARDTPGAMKAYLADRHPGVTGLTGTQAQVDRAKAAFRVFSRRVADDADPDGYAMPHTAFIYLLDAEGRIAAHFPDIRTARDIARTIADHSAPRAG
ncbi:SCO family protein [Sphingomonas colocasiae]|uniref:SCO family protein n=1 Tax=Sphingomonas colocasiae TaxID=1848973 RepID=A0ABS7PLH1_9SPHN|nr:SCO family protein [Sphingomonas colocasiae]MBY8822160.1 SCO family protein [Sphingomonas colocasiae]